MVSWNDLIDKNRSCDKELPFKTMLIDPININNELLSEKYNRNIDKENKEDKNMSNSNKILTKGIINVWLKKNTDEVDKYINSEKSKLKEKDECVSSIKSSIANIGDVVSKNNHMTPQELNKFYKKVFDYIADCVCYDGIYSASTEDAMATLDECYFKAKEKLNDKYFEVKIMCEPCETYEQEMAVLKTYGIVDDIGKIAVWEF